MNFSIKVVLKSLNKNLDFVKMIRFRAEFFSVFSLIIFVLSVVFISFDLEVYALSIKQNNELVARIAKDFSKKFCNGVAFGLSQESAVNFAMKENIATFKKKKGIENINTQDLIEKVSSSVIDQCGYPLNLSEDQWDFASKKVDFN